MRLVLVMLALLWFLPGAVAEEKVDARLILVLDSSQSMSNQRWIWQVQGYQNALRNPEVVQAIQSGPHGRIAIAVVRYSTNASVVMDWRIYDGDNTAAEIAADFRQIERGSKGQTSIGRGLLAALELLRSNDFHSIHDIILVSGDGRNNAGPAVSPLNQEIADYLKVSIVGAVMPEKDAGLLEYYQDFVIAGVGSFAQIIKGAEDFEEILKRLFVYQGRLR